MGNLKFFIHETAYRRKNNTIASEMVDAGTPVIELMDNNNMEAIVEHHPLSYGCYTINSKIADHRHALSRKLCTWS